MYVAAHVFSVILVCCMDSLRVPVSESIVSYLLCICMCECICILDYVCPSKQT